LSSTYWTNRKVLVTGGAGFIGSYLTELLLEEGAVVTVADNLSHGRLENLAGVRDKVRFIECDLRFLDVCERIAAGQDAVLNLAAPAFGVEYSMTHHGEMLTDTILIGFNMLEAARRAGVKRFLVVSSSCVYPDDAALPTPEDEGWRGTPETVNEGYGWGKRMVELQGQYYAREYGMEVAIARPFNAYGPREPIDKEKAHVMPALIQKILNEDDPVTVWGSGDQTRSFVHARDFALGLKLIAECHAVADPVNVGHDRETTIRDLAERIVRLSGNDCRLYYDLTKPEGATRKSADVRKLRGVTSFTPQITLDEGLSEMISYFREALAIPAKTVNS
jgi:GDP-L-fucose synthase